MTTVSSGQSLYVSSGQTSSGVVILGGGGLYVLSGGTASGTTVSSGGALEVLSGGFADPTTIFNGGSEVVSAGGEDVGALISGGTQYDYGTATRTTIDGNGSNGPNGLGIQEVGSGGTAISTTINSGGTQTLVSWNGQYPAGATATSTTINAGGIQDVFSVAIATSTTINSGGNQFVAENSTASGTTINGGTQYVSDFSQATDTTINSGGIQYVGSLPWTGPSNGSKAFSTTINSGGLEVVYSNNTTFGTTINAGGLEVVSSGGTARNTTIDSGGTLELLGGAIATVTLGGVVYTVNTTISTTINAGGLEVVSSGGTARGTTIDSGGTLELLGGAVGGTASGSGGALDGRSGGFADPTTVFSGGSEVVSAGGEDVGALISGGTQYDYGTATSTTINGNSTQTNQYVESGGTAINTIISGNGLGGPPRLGIQGVNSGGTATSTTISAFGWQNDAGTATSTTISAGGTQEVYDGATAISTTINGGEQILFGTGPVAPLSPLAIDTTINSGGLQWDYTGVASSTTINSGGIQLIQEGGTATGTTINGGTQNVLFDSTATGTTINSGGIQHVGSSVSSGAYPNFDSIVTSTTINSGGLEIVYTSNTATSTTINAGGLEIVSSGGTASSTTIDGGGTLELQAGGMAVGVTFAGISGTLALETPSLLSGTISNWQVGDIIDFMSASITSARVSGTTLTVTEAGNQIFNYQLANQQPGTGISLQGDGQNGTDLLLAEVNITVPASLTGNENTAISLSGISVSDSPNTGDTLTTVLTVSNGTISVGTSGGTVLSHNGTGSVTLVGTAAAIDTALGTTSYTGNLNYYGADSLSVTTADASSGATSGTSTVPITVTERPTVTSVVATGSGITAGAGDLNAGSVVTLTVNLSEAVTVTGGTPTLALNDLGTAIYDAAKSTSTALAFDYTVAAGQDTPALAVTAVNLNGATVTNSIPSTVTGGSGQSLTDAQGNVWSFGAADIYGYAILRDGVQYAGGSGETLALDTNGVIWTQNNLNSWYMVTASGWAGESNGPTLTTVTGGSGQSLTDAEGNVWSFGAADIYGYAILRDGVQYAGGSGETLALDTNGVIWTQNNLNSWYMVTASGWAGSSTGPTGQAADLTGAVTTLTGPLQIDTTAPGPSGPTVTSVVATGSGITAGAGDLNAGSVVTLTVNLSEAVTVTGGTPTLVLNDLGTAIYDAAKSTSTALAFDYTVAAGQDTPALAVTALNLNGASVTNSVPTTVAGGSGLSLTDAQGHVWSFGAADIYGNVILRDGVQYAGGAGESLALDTNGVIWTQNNLNSWYMAVATGWAGSSTGPTGQAADLTGAVTTLTGPLQIDTTSPGPSGPTVTSVVATGSGITAGAGDLNAGSVVTLTVNLSEAVTVTGGTPTLSLNDLGTAIYTGGTGTKALTFSYTVAAGQDTPALAVTAVNLNGATVANSIPSTVTGGSGQLTDAQGNVWSFGAADIYGYAILRDGVQYAGGAGESLALDTNGVIWTQNNLNSWYMAVATGWAGSSTGPTGQAADLTGAVTTLTGPLQIDTMATWAAGISGTWQTAANWNPVAVPDSGYSASITAPGTYTVTDPQTTTVYSIATAAGATLDITGGTFTAIGTGTAASVTNAGTLSANGADLVIMGDVNNTGNLDANNGNVTIQGVVTGGTATIEGTGKIEFGASSAANITFAANADGILRIDQTFAGTVAGMATGDGIDLANFLFSNSPTVVSVTGSGNAGTTTNVTINDGLQNITLDLLNQYANQFAVNSSAYSLTADNNTPNQGTQFQLAAPH